jgi:hypothetical protein
LAAEGTHTAGQLEHRPGRVSAKHAALFGLAYTFTGLRQ